jgi:hypothetical protein
VVTRLFRAIDRLDKQWLPALTLGALVATLVLGVLVSATATPLVERTGKALVNLQLSGAYPLLAWVPGGKGKTPTRDLLKQWNDAGLIRDARRSQRIDFGFALAYGLFWLLLAVATWRTREEYPHGARWVWLIAVGALAALFDECENVLLWNLLKHPTDPNLLLAHVASVFSLAKIILLILAPLMLVAALRRARA